VKLYHGTSESRARRIMLEGIKPRGKCGETNWKHTLESNPKAVYLTDAYPLYFAAQSTNAGERWAVIEVETDLLDDSRLHPDEDVLEQAFRKSDELPRSWSMYQRGRWYRKQAIRNPNWEARLKDMGTCAYYGTIPPTAITRVVMVDTKKIHPGFLLRLIDCTITLGNYFLSGEEYRAITQWVMGAEKTPRDLGYWNESKFEAVAGCLADRSAFETVRMICTREVG
jgi:hypothetical protein